jgi:hypothetical protein
MAAPTPGSRTVPSGYKLQDGQYTHIALAEDPAVQFFEKTVKLAGIDGGPPVPQTTLFNVTWRTFAPRVLRTLTETSGKAAYDPNVIVFIVASCNFPTTATIIFPTNAKFAYYAFLQKIEFDPLEEGKQPELNYTIAPTNIDYVNGFVEAGPTYQAAAGTA